MKYHFLSFLYSWNIISSFKTKLNIQLWAVFVMGGCVASQIDVKAIYDGAHG